MNQRQRESVAGYCYDISKAVHIGWMIGLAAGNIPWWYALILAMFGFDFFIYAYKQEASNG